MSSSGPGAMCLLQEHGDQQGHFRGMSQGLETGSVFARGLDAESLCSLALNTAPRFVGCFVVCFFF